ncbi:winged helix-turn-helix domain-containing protein [Spirobacillus cienkowskii]|jgi:two-component system copper resistance phosphate regulon response regulator CusR|uniref:Response regulator n=1 Tax=Spirobacillus cienkowskii TaxID=495820 RepID=A0A369KQW0_9BACT|nr:MAG: response regulator [Spirobacillus cienkowskii]
MKVLIIEESIKSGLFLKKGLTERGYVVDTEALIQEGLLKPQNSIYDFIILEIPANENNHWKYLKQFRDINTHSFLIIISACHCVEDKILSLNLGADDYLTKPFSFLELIARLNTISRRNKCIQKKYIKIKDLEIDLNQHKLIRNGNTIHLTPKEFSLLSLLIQNRGFVLSRCEILEKLWNVSYDTDSNIIDVHIKRLRSKIEDGLSSKFIKTVRGAGYMFETEKS